MKSDQVEELFVRHLHGEALPDEEVEVERLRNESEAHAQLYRELAAIKITATEVSDVEATGRPGLTDRIMASLDTVSREKKRRVPVWFTPTGAFAGGIAMFSLVIVMIAVFGPDFPRPAPQYGGGGGSYRRPNGSITYNDSKITNSTNAILLYLEGSFGALVFLLSALLALIFLLAWLTTKRRRYGYIAATLAFLSGMAFLLRMLLATFFNDTPLTM